MTGTDGPTDRKERNDGTGRLILYIAALALIGAPMVLVLWTALNELLAGHLAQIDFTLVGPVALAFCLYLYIVAKLVNRWEEET